MGCTSGRIFVAFIMGSVYCLFALSSNLFSSFDGWVIVLGFLEDNVGIDCTLFQSSLVWFLTDILLLCREPDALLLGVSIDRLILYFGAFGPGSTFFAILEHFVVSAPGFARYILG